MLADDLKAKLDATSLIQGFVSSMTGHSSSLNGVSPPVSADQVNGTAGLSAGVSTGGISASIAGVSGQTGGILGALPVPTDSLKPLTAALDLVKQVTDSDPATQIGQLLDRISAELSGPQNGNFLDIASGMAGLVSGAPELQGLLSLLSTVLQASGLNFDPFQTLRDLPGTFVGSIRAIGALMNLKSMMAEADRLTAIMAAQLDPGKIGDSVAVLRSLFGQGEETLSAFAQSGGTDPDQASAALSIALECAAGLADTSALLARAMGFGEATLVHLDLASLKDALQAATTTLRAIDPDSIGRSIKSLVDSLTPGLNLQLGAAAANSLDALLTLIHNESDNIAATISQVDVAALADPLAAGLAKVTSVADALANVIAQVTSTVRGALEKVRQAVAALPFDEVGRSIQTALAPVTQAMNAIEQLVGSVETALKTVVQTIISVLADIEQTVDTLKADLQQLLGAAADFIKGLHLDHAAGQMAGGIRTFVNVLDKAQMKPYFDTATGAVNTAADAISKVPLGLLPDSMKSDLDNAVAPIRAISVDQVKDEIEGLLGIEGGKFELRTALEQALADIKQSYDAAIAALKSGDPRQLIPPIDGAVGDVKTQISSLVPQLSLKPLEDAVSSLKSALGSFDPRAELKPISDVFQKVLDAIDEFSPDKLIKPVEDEINTARQRLKSAIALDQWSTQVDVLAAQAAALVDYLDPVAIGLEELIGDALNEAGSLLEQLGNIDLWSPFGDVVSSLLGGSSGAMGSSSFNAITGWLAGASGASELQGHAGAIAAAITATQQGVQSIDLVSLGAELAQHASAMQAAAAALPAGSDIQVELTGVTAGLTVDELLTPLSANQTRYAGELNDAATVAATLVDTGVSQADATAKALASAFSPITILGEFRDRLLQQLGLSLGQDGVAGLIRGILATVTPARLADIFNPIISAVHERVTVLLNAITSPIKTAISHLTAAIDAIDLTPLQQSIDAVYNQMRTQIEALDPMKILAPTLDAFDKLKADLLAFDPLKNLHDLINALTSSAVRIVSKLQADQILASPITIFDGIVKALSAIDPEALLQPVLDELDNLAAQVDSGLDEIAKAIERLQAALPAPGGGGVGGAISGAVSVSF